jgi:hypothetical protein
MAKQCEQERTLAMRAVGELKVMRGQLTEKDTVIGKKAECIKELLGTVEV